MAGIFRKMSGVKTVKVNVYRTGQRRIDGGGYFKLPTFIFHPISAV